MNAGAFALAILTGSLGLLLVDNFTYTIFGFGIISTWGVTAVLYLWGYLLLLLSAFLEIKKSLSSFEGWIAKRKLRKAADLALVPAWPLHRRLRSAETSGRNSLIAAERNADTLNILLITRDGLNAYSTLA